MLMVAASTFGYVAHRVVTMNMHKVVVSIDENERGEANAFGQSRPHKSDRKKLSTKAGVRHFRKSRASAGSEVQVRVVGGGSWWEEAFNVIAGGSDRAV